MVKEKEIARSIRMHERVWRALDQDADRCLRSSNRQIEAILIAYYALGDIELKETETVHAKVSGRSGSQRFLAAPQTSDAPTSSAQRTLEYEPVTDLDDLKKIATGKTRDDKKKSQS